MQSSNVGTAVWNQITRLLEHLRTPLFRNAYALMLSTGITSGLGMLFWMMATRMYSEAAVGENSALVSIFILLSNLAKLNLNIMLNRFIPSAGSNTKKLILSVYGVSLLTSLVTSTVFVLGVNTLAPSLAFIRESNIFTVWFILSTMLWTIFTIEEGALIGLRRATIVPIGNLIYAIGKIILLIILVGILPRFGLYLAWTLPLILLIIPINSLIFGRIIPNMEPPKKQQQLKIRPMLKFVLLDYVGEMLAVGILGILPLIILERLGPEANAYFYLAWSVVYVLFLLNINMGMSLIAEGSADETSLYYLTYRALIQNTRLMVPIVVVLVIGAPLILNLFGHNYSVEGTLLLRLLTLAALPDIIIHLYINLLRVQQRVMMAVVVQAVLYLPFLALMLLSLDHYGLPAIGASWLAAHIVVATAIVILQFGQIRQALLIARQQEVAQAG